MTRRLATMCLMTVLLIEVTSPLVRANSITSLKGISAVYVLVEEIPDGAKILGLTKETIQTDVELKLRLAGVGVLTADEAFNVHGFPHLYVQVNLTRGAEAASIDVEMMQNARLERNGDLAVGVSTWSTGILLANPTAQGVRDDVKDSVDKFLNAWLSVNPKK